MSHSFQVDLRGIVDLLSHHLYGSPRVYIRELLQNAADAITARRTDQPTAPASIWFETAKQTYMAAFETSLTSDDLKPSRTRRSSSCRLMPRLLEQVPWLPRRAQP